MQNKPTVSIGIPAYNAEQNIVNIVKALLSQTGNFELKQIIIHSDNSKDNTVNAARSIHDGRVTVIDNKDRLGFAGSLKRLIESFDADYLITLNDDVLIEDRNNFIENIVQVFLSEDKVGMVCGKITPLPAVNFIDKAITSTFNGYKRIRERNSGNQKFTVDGKVLALSKEFSRSLVIPQDTAFMGCADTYLYFACITGGYKYRYASRAEVFYRNPTTIHDYLKWVSRNNANRSILKKSFDPKIVDREYTFPDEYKKYFYVEFLKNPIGCTFIQVLKIIRKMRTRSIEKNFDSKWETVATTKNLQR
jgi:GT2 family glycosyltransferase